ncbi:hypothetical protein NPX13_g7740 [Xylaria arbuscula]|uniref:LrgB-like protein n=1 Tax=Xylaria arbuscula TaxID=114810 RepID=A0A9W8TK38_9PEZI|nr:hypothetical protein NPX13_g7740 [Xylaria arbuscula]
MASTQEICKGLQTPGQAKRYTDALVGLGFILGCQLLVVPIQLAFDTHSINIPASILVMLFFFFTMTIASSVDGDVAKFYDRHLRGPTDFVGRHMSLGFVTFFILLIKDHIEHVSDIPKLTGAFVVTTIIGYLVSYLLAYGGFNLESRFRKQKRAANDMESNNEIWPSPPVTCPSPSYEWRVVRPDRLSTLSEALSTSEPLVEISTTAESPTSKLIAWILRTLPIWICLFLIAVVGLPIYQATGYMLLFDVFSLTLFWVASVQFQRSLRSSQSLLHFRRLRSLTLIFCNPILITWALATAYMYAKAACVGPSVEFVIKDFRHFSSLSKCILHIMGDHDVPAHLGAGDLAGLLLDAGVACMGFKMYEYRAELWASLGTVTVTCTALAAISVFLNVLIAHGCGLQAADALAFAGRSATLALGIPAIENIGGSTTLASSVAVFSGIVWQMAGDWLLSVLHINDRAPRDHSKPLVKPPPVSEKSFGVFSKAKPVAHTEEKKEDSNSNNDCAKTSEESSVVAAGVTIGINAAAMGTAYLIERDSRAVAYSALSMILFGAATVALTAFPATTTAIKMLTSS